MKLQPKVYHICYNKKTTKIHYKAQNTCNKKIHKIKNNKNQSKNTKKQLTRLVLLLNLHSNQHLRFFWN